MDRMMVPRFVRRYANLLLSKRHNMKWSGIGWTAAIAAVLLVGGILSWLYWEDLGSETDSHSTTIRNVALVIGGIIAMLLAVWRSIVAQRQATIAQLRLLSER